jgi:hypothetical protein
MLKILSALIIIMATTACATTGMSKDLLKENLLKEAQPLYQSCLEDYKKTMSDKDARKACTEKLKSGYDKMTKS